MGGTSRSQGQWQRAQRQSLQVRVRRDLLAACMTCPLCRKLLRDATTVSECLHTFCRKCILEKITEEEVDSCPICHIDLGCVPAEKLRPDHNLQDIKNKLFPLKRKNSGTPEPPSLPLPARRKERSLSSLVVSAPRVSSQSTGRRTKSSRRAVKSPANDENTSNKKAKVLDDEKTASVPPRLAKLNRKHSNLDPETSGKDKENVRDDQQLDKSELWKPLNCLLEAATRTKSLKSGTHSNEEEKNDNSNNEKTANKFKAPKEEKQPQEDKNAGPSCSEQPQPVKRKSRIRRRNKERDTTPRPMFESISTVRDRRMGPVWFSLVATANREGGGQLPQLPSSYLRIKDGELTVSSIQKYIMMKLHLNTEEEVEIVCRGQPVGPAMTLHDLVDLWLRSETSNRTHASVGSPAKDFIMVLAYRHRPSLLLI